MLSNSSKRTHVQVVPLPRELTPEDVRGRLVVVFDVLRATTTMTAALAAGVGEIRIFDSLDDARRAAAAHTGPGILCGEHKCLPPRDFDLGNSPGAFRSTHHAGRVAFMATTNGTRALVAARQAALLLTGALVNARAVAAAIRSTPLDVTLLGAGTDGAVAEEDLIGTGAVLDALNPDSIEYNLSPAAQRALTLFRDTRDSLPRRLAQTQGGQNVIRAGLAADVDFAARLNTMQTVGRVLEDPLRVVRWGDV